MDLTEYGWLPLLSFVTLVLGFSTGYGPIPWLMMGEILPGNNCYIALLLLFLLAL